jgi:hypothetical protein
LTAFFEAVLQFFILKRWEIDLLGAADDYGEQSAAFGSGHSEGPKERFVANPHFIGTIRIENVRKNQAAHHYLPRASRLTATSLIEKPLVNCLKCARG